MPDLNSISSRILFEDNHLIIVNKLPSEIVQGDKTGNQPMSELLKEYIKEKYDKPGDVFLGVVHRIDRPVSGAVVFARTSKALSRMTDLIRKREIKKTYWAIVKNRPPEDEATLTNFLSRNEAKNKSFVTKNEGNGAKEAILSYKLKAKSNDYFLLEINLETGRHHQIRAQMAAIGCPIKGDLKYGFARSNPDASISLHARSVEFIHPIRKEPLIAVANPPDDSLWNFFLAADSAAGHNN
ncbi:MAG TPA: RNA pseudouridine synthase [Bacteroidales bacterium]